MFFTRVIKNLKLFKKEFILNILFSALYALFSAIAFFSLMPMLEVLFNGCLLYTSPSPRDFG